ncbi:MAG: hypothetical protein AAFY42_12665 [Pseudomonadota bacterium]
MQMDKSKHAGPAFVAIGAVFMATVNAGVGAAFLAIGAALIARGRNSDAPEENSEEQER